MGVLFVGQSLWVMAMLVVPTSSHGVAHCMAVVANLPVRLGIVSILVALSTILPIVFPIVMEAVIGLSSNVIVVLLLVILIAVVSVAVLVVLLVILATLCGFVLASTLLINPLVTLLGDEVERCLKIFVRLL